MRKSVSSLLEELFKNEDREITMDNFYSIVGTSTGNSLTNALFLFINDSLDEYDGKIKLDYVLKAFDFMMIVLENNPDINRKSIKKKLKKLLEKVDRIMIEKKNVFSDQTSVHKELGKIQDAIFAVEQSTKIKESKQYKLLKFIINDTKNLEYLEETFSHLPNSVNVVDKEGKTLFYNVLKKYIEKLESTNTNKEEILYYNNIILLMKNQENFELDEKSKRDCLQLIYNSLDHLDYKQQEFELKKEFLSSMKDIVVEDDVNKIGMDKLTSKYNISIGFNNSLIDELGIYQNSFCKDNYPDRVIVDDYIITIDGYGASEIDDGLSARKLDNGNYLLGVHVASPLSYLPYGSSIVKEAISRGNCIYLNKGAIDGKDPKFSKVIPIFPFSFSAGSASLLPLQYRLAKSYYFELDKDGNVVDEKYLNTIIQNNQKCTYYDVNDVISNGSDNKKLEETINVLDDIAYKLEEKYNPEDIYEDIKSKTVNPANVKVGKSRAEMIVSRSMLLTGNRVADFFANSKEGYPTLYRVHSIEQDDIERLESEIRNLSNEYDKERFNRLYQVLLGIYPKAKYDVSGSHDGLGLDHYCHCTSPLRRSADIVVEHSLDVCYFSNPTDKELCKLEEIIKDAKTIINSKSNDTELFLGEYNRQRSQRKKCKVK